MDQTDEGSTSRPRRRGRFQFSLRTLFVVTTLLAALLSGLLGGPAWLTVLTGLVVLVAAPVTILTVGVYGGGYQRTFCLGASVAAVMPVFGASPYTPVILLYYLYEEADDAFPLQVTLFLAGWIVAMVVAGLLAMAVRWVVERPALGELREPFAGAAASPCDANRPSDPA